MCCEQCCDGTRQEVSYFFHLFFRFWVWVGFSAQHVGRAEKFFVRFGHRTLSFWRPRPPRFEVRCAQMAKADARGRSLCATNAPRPRRDPFAKRSWRHGKRAVHLRCLLLMRGASRFALRPGCLPRLATMPERRE